jgi:methyltransferase-like protein/cyclopropane fatty-acyl-phospholipid synthase-like methyltransferase
MMELAMAEVQQSSYEEIPYSSNPFAYTHPDCLSTVGMLYGMNPPPVENCRVLELGCAAGGNIIPMALSLPESKFVGIDLSPRQIAMGQEIVDALELANIELKAQSIMDIKDSDGPYDYIICHGVYSWVPAEVQDKILTICRRNLTPQGVAYISYNTYPGWHMRGMIRDLLKFHVKQFPDGPTRVAQARAFLDFLVKSVPNPNTLYAQMLQVEADLLRDASDSYLFHEHLEDVNSPQYFYQFAESAAAMGLQYVAEAKFSPMGSILNPEVIKTLRQLSHNPIYWEQYMDFLRNMTFRRSLLCHAEVALAKTPDLEALSSFYITARAKPVKEVPDPQPDSTEEFSLTEEIKLRTNHPILKSALRALYEIWPQSLTFEALITGVRTRLAPMEVDPRSLAQALLRCYAGQFVELHRFVPRFVTEVSDRPRGSPLARLQARTSGELTNLRHYIVNVNDLDRMVLSHLDGSRDIPRLVDMMEKRIAEGDLKLEHNGQATPERADVRGILEQEMPTILQRLAKHALLVA